MRRRRRKSILPALIIESLALLALGGIYFGTNPFAASQTTEWELPPVPLIADSVREFSDLLKQPALKQPAAPLTDAPTPPETPPLAISPPLPAGEMLYLR